jgi:phosphoglycerate dehydrogenase-like enzyme
MVDRERFSSEHSFRSLPNVLATPHIGYVADDLYRTFYQDTVSNIISWMAKQGGADPR